MFGGNGKVLFFIVGVAIFTWVAAFILRALGRGQYASLLDVSGVIICVSTVITVVVNTILQVYGAAKSLM